MERLPQLFVQRGTPELFSSDDRAGFSMNAQRGWFGPVRVQTLGIESGCLWEKGFVEPFDAELRDELLKREISAGLEEAKVLVEPSSDHGRRACGGPTACRAHAGDGPEKSA